MLPPGGQSMRADLAQSEAWIRRLHGNSRGLLHLCASGDWTGGTFHIGDGPGGIEAALPYIRAADEAGREGVYLRATTIGRRLGPGERGHASDSVSLPGLWADIDLAGPGHKHIPCDGGQACTHVTAAGNRQHHARVLPLPGDQGDAMAIIAEAKLPEPTLLVHSGGGLYPWWLFDPEVDLTDDPLAATMAPIVSQNLQEVLTAAAARLGFHYGSGVGDLARVLRMPGTVNRKDGLERPCRVLHDGGSTVDLLDFGTLIGDLHDAVVAERQVTRTAPVAAVSAPAPATGGRWAPAGIGAPGQPRPAGAPVTGETPFDDFELRTDWATILEPFGWVLHHSGVDGTRYWTRPGKDRRDGHSATTGRAGDRDRMYCLSDAAGLPVGTPMNKAHVWGLLNGYGGATKDCALALRNGGYGRSVETFTAPTPTVPAGGVGFAAPQQVMVAGQPAPVPATTPQPPAPPTITRIEAPSKAETEPKLDPAALHGLAGEFVRSVLPYTEAGEASLLATFLASAGCHLGDRFHIAAGNTRQTPKVWPMLCGETSAGAKGTAVSVVGGFWRAADPGFAAVNRARGLSSGEGLIRMVRDGNLDDPNTQPGSGDADPGVTDKRRWIDESEMASMMERGGREGNSLSAVLRQAYDWETLQTITSSNPLRATTPHIVVTAHITPTELIRKMTRTDAANGFGNRFLIIHSKRSKYLPDGSDVPAEVLLRLRNAYLDAREHLYRSTADRADAGVAVGKTPEAQTLWNKIYVDRFEQIDAMAPGATRDMMGRWHANAQRLALIYALLDGKTTIDVPHLRAALAVIDYAAQSTTLVFDGTVDDTALGKLAEFVETSESAFIGPDGTAVTGVKRGDIGRKLFRNNISKQQMDHLLLMLLRTGKYAGIRVRVPGGGRPYEVYYRIDDHDGGTHDPGSGG